MSIIFIHLALCMIFVLCGHPFKKNRIGEFPVVVVFLVPVFGFIMWCAEVYITKKPNANKKDLGMGQYKMTDPKYRNLATDTDIRSEEMVPLEDAFAINDSKLRRSLLLNILHKNPEEYLATLSRAKASDDVEVTHYATTTLLEIQSDFEQRLQDYIRKLPQKKWDTVFLHEYAECLKKYIDSGLVDGSVLTMQQQTLYELMELILKAEDATREDYFLYIENALDLGKYEEVAETFAETKHKYAETEKWNRLAVRYYWETGQREEIDKMLANIKKSGIYLTKDGKEWFRFWSRGKTYEET